MLLSCTCRIQLLCALEVKLRKYHSKIGFPEVFEMLDAIKI